MSINAHRARLHVTILAALGIAHLAGCGARAEDGGTTDGGPDNIRNDCQPRYETHEVEVRGSLCATDAGADASSADTGTTADGGDPLGDSGADAGTDGGACFISCQDACRTVAQVGSGATCTVSSSDRITCTFVTVQHCGRAFDGLEPLRGLDGRGLGPLFAGMAWMEAASIAAFRRLGRELADHGAPEHLVRAVRHAARDEARHARIMGRLARRHGATVPRVEHAPFVMRSLEEIARENAVEACVGETYGAALAAWQARHARDPEVRAAMASIAPDELGHAALGYAIADWATTRLGASARRRVRAAKRAALAALVVRVAGAANDALSIREAGMPSPSDAARLAMAVARAA